MFSSGNNGHVHTDEQPWQGADESRRARYSRFAPRFAPRPEFDRPLTNPANPILQAFREREDIGNVYAVRQWFGFVCHPDHWDGTICKATKAQADHARRVFALALRLHQ